TPSLPTALSSALDAIVVALFQSSAAEQAAQLFGVLDRMGSPRLEDRSPTARPTQMRACVDTAARPCLCSQARLSEGVLDHLQHLLVGGASGSGDDQTRRDVGRGVVIDDRVMAERADLVLRRPDRPGQGVATEDEGVEV